MADDQRAQEQQAEAPPAWFQQYTEGLGNRFQQQDQTLHAIAQRVAQLGPPQPAKPTPPQPAVGEVRERLLNTIANEPERFVSEVIGFADQRAEQRLNERLQAERGQQEQERVARQFWHDFYGQNPDLTLWAAEVKDAFENTNHPDPSVRANTARDVVRQKMQLAQQQSQEAQQMQLQNRRSMAGAPGMGMGSPERGGPEPMDEGQRTAQALDERRKWKESRAGNNLRSDPEYHEQMRQIKLQRERVKGTRAA